MKTPESVRNIFEDFFTKQIEKLRESTRAVAEIESLDIINSEVINSFDCPVAEVAINMLKEIRYIGGDEEETIYNEFMAYLAGRKYENLSEFLAWLEEV